MMEAAHWIHSHPAIALVERARKAKERGLPVCLAADLCGPGKCSLAATGRACGHVLNHGQVQHDRKSD